MYLPSAAGEIQEYWIFRLRVCGPRGGGGSSLRESDGKLLKLAGKGWTKDGTDVKKWAK
jgi:hypothetical protein